MKKAVIICGPTASGKTNFAHELARKNNGEIINADSMQIYQQLPIITASPSQKLKQDLPYHLYNFLNIDTEFSAAKYATSASRAISEISNRGKLPIIVGGSGMYINMLIYGFSSIPDINNQIRSQARSLHKELGSETFFDLLKTIDPEVAKTLNVGDTQRVLRAYEVIKQSGKSILYYQAQGNLLPLPDFDFDVTVLMPERSFLYETCNNRFLALLEEGAIEEIKAVHQQYNNLNTTAMKALGVSEIISYLKGEITKEKAIALALAKTRQYAKRQCTWFNNQIKEKRVIKFSNFAEYISSTSNTISFLKS
ncbi:MAG: tRNA (adenosine(37)-N6)-dimethylallyltransferase MiaA [Rickettsiaceae bacterium]|nr:tRNA (adenosine(37)-N6)-dimethylallyltransferase MiaA [Rickettsiaceae bacterium]